MYQRSRYFLKAADCGSFSLAAQALYVSPQALTKQIGVLEGELGGPLFLRSKRGVELTGLGRFAQQRLSGVFEGFEQALRDIRAHAGEDRERITVGIFSALPREELVLPFVSSLLAFYPDSQIALEMVELSAGLRKFLDGKLDFLLTNTHDQDDLTGYARLSFGRHDAKVVVSLIHPWAMKERVTAEDLRQENFIKMRMDDDHYLVPAEKNFYKNIPCRKVVEASNFETLMLLLRQGAGFAVIPLAFTNLRAAQIKAFDYPGEPLRFSTALLYDPNTPVQGVNRIVQKMQERFDAELVTT